MFSVISRMKLGHSVEFAYDLEGKTPFTMTKIKEVKGFYLVSTDYSYIAVSKDTKFLTARGLWVTVDKLQIGELVKGQFGNMIVSTIRYINNHIDMYKVTNTDYVIVNSFYIDN